MPPKTKRRKTKQTKRAPKPIILVPVADRVLTGGNLMNVARRIVGRDGPLRDYINSDKGRATILRTVGDLFKSASGGLVYDPTQARVREFMERGHRPIKVRTFPFERKWHGNYKEL